MSRYHLAQLNIAALRAPLDSPELADFVANLDRVNELADRSPGFVWRLVGEGDDATSLRPFGEDLIVNMSVWASIDALSRYVYDSAHVDIMRRRREWFERMADSHLVLWWVRHGHIPTVAEAAERLEYLRRHGPTKRAFTFRACFDPPDEAPGEILRSASQSPAG